MSYITLEEAKKHCNIEEGYTDDDAYIGSLIDVAEKVVSEDICVELEMLEDSNGDIPAPLKQAALLLIGHYYNFREAVAFGVTMQVPLGYKHLTMLYRNYSG